MKRTVSAALILFATSFASTAARAELIDPEYKAVQDKMKSEVSARCPNNAGPRHMTCFENILQDYKSRGLMRGTTQYIDLKYGSFSAKDLNQQIIDRNKFYGQTTGSSFNLKPGEITNEMMSIEVSELHHLIDLKGGARALQ